MKRSAEESYIDDMKTSAEETNCYIDDMKTSAEETNCYIEDVKYHDENRAKEPDAE